MHVMAADLSLSNPSSLMLPLNDHIFEPNNIKPGAGVAAARMPYLIETWQALTECGLAAGQVRYTEALNYFLSADIKALKKGLQKSKPTHRLLSCFMRLQKVTPPSPPPPPNPLASMLAMPCTAD